MAFAAQPAYRVGKRVRASAPHASGSTAGQLHTRARHARRESRSPDAVIARDPQRTAPRRRLGREPKLQFEGPGTEALLLQPSVPEARGAQVRKTLRRNSPTGERNQRTPSAAVPLRGLGSVPVASAPSGRAAVATTPRRDPVIDRP